MSPYHISRRCVAEWADGGRLTYGELFEAEPSAFHPQYPVEPHDTIPNKMENHLGEYYQVALFLIIERLKQEKSFYKPFLDYLPAQNETLFTIDANLSIGPENP